MTDHLACIYYERDVGKRFLTTTSQVFEVVYIVTFFKHANRQQHFEPFIQLIDPMTCF
jgi:hypothetical protein